jgi:NitT/TauT family transport system permease protein
MRISAGASVVGAIVGDYFFRRGEPGLGSLISNYQSRVQGPELFAAIIVASLFGVVVFLVFGWLGKLAVGRWYDYSK